MLQFHLVGCGKTHGPLGRRGQTHLVSHPLLGFGQLLLYVVLQFGQLTVVHLLGSVLTQKVTLEFGPTEAEPAVQQESQAPTKPE